MEFLHSLIEYDKQLLLFLHSKGSVTWDIFWLFITNPLNWIPLFFLLFYLVYTIYDFKKTFFISLLTFIAGFLSLTTVNIIKNFIQRKRPINDESINETLRILIEQNDFSFVSGHSTVSFTIAFISFWILKKNYKYAFLIFLFPILFAYSRIYLAAHYPIDILVGMLLGYIIAFIFYRLIKRLILKQKTT